MPRPSATPVLSAAALVEAYLPGLIGAPLDDETMTLVARRQLVVCHALLAQELVLLANPDAAQSGAALGNAGEIAKLIARLSASLEGAASRRQRLGIERARIRARRPNELAKPRREARRDVAFEEWCANIIMGLPDECFADGEGRRDEPLFYDVLFGTPLWMARAARGYPPLDGRVGQFHCMEHACKELDWQMPPEPHQRG